ncbi:hypothetical protein INH39_20275 [Massilia violaceinigra]|uniref:Type VI secretion system amidase effector protein Tae4 n=1 Tax=Massilia violaceinigra TaxID=2045208 RepID=A0ABY4A5A7_9BURK|nr:T6SS effector amidase Tae4 family protein [Massilia violaceinigra]UOD27818.1 hypothetical protein INH39_20275 [Massilia violaceinigra]
MKPSFASLREHYPFEVHFLRDNLYDHLGWPDLKTHPAYTDTCAIRMSVGLAGAKVIVPGPLTIKNGPLAGKSVEPSQAKLSRFLKRHWGAPEVYKSDKAARDGIANRSGVISFFSIHGAGGGSQGHIDLVEPNGLGYYTCAMNCHFKSVEMWFWPLQ